MHLETKKITQLENMAIANALQLEAIRRGALPIRFNFAAHVKFEFAQPIRCRLRAFYCWYVTLRCDLELWPRDLDLGPLTLNMCSRPASPRSSSVRNLSEIKQSTAELFRFEYLTLWHWTRITCCGIVCTKFKLSQAIRSWKVTIFWC